MPLFPLPVGDFSIGYFEIRQKRAVGSTELSPFITLGLALKFFELKAPGAFFILRPIE
jgi:hypothetical protein